MKKIIIILGIGFLLACDKDEVSQVEMPQPISILLAGEWVTISVQSDWCDFSDLKNKLLEIKRINDEEVAFDIFEYLKPMDTSESNGNTNTFIAKEELIWKIKDWENNRGESILELHSLDNVILYIDIGMTLDILSPDVIMIHFSISGGEPIGRCTYTCTEEVCPFIIPIISPTIELKKRK